MSFRSDCDVGDAVDLVITLGGIHRFALGAGLAVALVATAAGGEFRGGLSSLPMNTIADSTVRNCFHCGNKNTN